MKPTELPSLDSIKEVFFLEDGVLHRHSSGRVDVARHRSGYKFVGLHGKRHALHRIVYCLANEVWISQSDRIDHIDGDTENNDPQNLRICDMASNSRNQKVRITNKSGTMGVRTCKNKARWRAEIGVNGKNVHIGYFDTFDEACAARRDAEMAYGYHQNHGCR